MSVLVDMLNRLEARGASAAPALPAATAAVPRMQAARGTSMRARVWSATVAIVVIVGAALAWTEHRSRHVALERKPLGWKEYGAAIASASHATTPAPSHAAPAATAAAPVVAPPVTEAPARSTPTAHRAPRVAAPARAEARSRPAAAAPAAEAPAVRRSAASLADPDAELARAAELIARGRNSEAKPLLRQLLAQRPTHADARLALAALQAESGARDQALATLLEGAALDPVRFAPRAAQLQVELGDASGALATLSRVPAGARNGAYYALAGGVAQRAGQPAAAVDAYQRALRTEQTNPVWWIGLAVALEALGRQADAHAAFARADAQPTLPADLRAFARVKLQALAASTSFVSTAPAGVASAGP